MSNYSGPEMVTERRVCGRIRAIVLQDPCRYCVHGVSGWGASACSTKGRTFPMCTKRGAPAFEPDHERIEETMRARAA
jgi:hypothetical protein